jgi:hypothetical protein
MNRIDKQGIAPRQGDRFPRLYLRLEPGGPVADVSAAVAMGWAKDD